MSLQALQECQGRLKGLVQGMATMQAELSELQAKQHGKAHDQDNKSGLLPALHSPMARCEPVTFELLQLWTCARMQ